MKQHFCPAEQSMIAFEKECNWCGKQEGSMTQEEIIEMAEQAGVDEWWDSGNEQREVLQEHLEAFAKLVAAKEREACIEACRKTITSQRSAWGANFCIEAIRARGQGTPERGKA
jgi:hypothetical protein